MKAVHALARVVFATIVVRRARMFCAHPKEKHMHVTRMASAVLAAVITFAAAPALSNSDAQQAADKPAVVTTPEVFNFDKLAAQAKEMLAKAKPGAGSVGATIAKYPGYYISLNARNKNGGGEFHKNWNDILIVLDGEGTEYTGGTMVDGKDAPGGEIRGTRLEGATAHPMHKGDFISIPSSTNHMQTVAPGHTLVVLAIKIDASNPAAASAALVDLMKQQSANAHAPAGR
ncbi:MAG TPA: hypothetical protein VGN16_16965 [Acidobacteriaceae bacterium]|jgi:hypothetical protein